MSPIFNRHVYVNIVYYAHIYIYVYIYTCVFVYTIYIYIYTYIYIYICSSKSKLFDYQRVSLFIHAFPNDDKHYSMNFQSTGAHCPRR